MNCDFGIYFVKYFDRRKSSYEKEKLKMNLKELLFLFTLFFCIDLNACWNGELVSKHLIVSNFFASLTKHQVLNLISFISQQKPHHQHHNHHKHQDRQHHHHHHRFRKSRHIAVDCDSQILEKSNITFLAYAAGLNEHCSKLATDIFERRLASNFIEILTVDSVSFDILKHFGHLIPNLAINLVRFGSLCTANEISKYRNFLQYASHYGRNSVINLRISYNENCWNTQYDVDIFNGIKSSFDRVENVSINLRGATISTNNVRLNKIIPNVRHLELNFESLSDPKFVAGEYPFLEKLSISGRLLDKSYDEIFKNLLVENPHIRLVSLVQPSYQTFHHLKTFLKNLEEIEIHQSVRGERPQETINFTSVKRLVLQFDRHGCHPHEGITFGPELNELVLECQPQNTKYFNTLFAYRQIKKLSTGSTKWNDQNLLKLVGEFPMLTQAELVFHENVTVDSIEKFIWSNKKLNVLLFHYALKSQPKEFLKQLQTSIGNKFEIHANKNDSKPDFFAIGHKTTIQSGAKQMGFNDITLLSATLIASMLGYIFN